MEQLKVSNYDTTVYERLLGGLGLLSILILYYALGRETSPGEYVFFLERLGNFLTIQFMAFSFLYRFFLAIGSRVKQLAFVELFFFVLMLVYAATCVDRIVSYQRDPFFEGVIFFTFLPPVVIDIATSFWRK